MTSNVESQALRTALESEIIILEETREALPEESHLRTLCNLAVERLEACVSTQRRAVPSAGPSPPSQIHANKKGRLAGTIRRIAVDPLHPTGWMFATKLSEMPLEATLDASHVMNAAERLEGQQVLLTGYFAGGANMRLVADSIEPQ